MSGRYGCFEIGATTWRRRCVCGADKHGFTEVDIDDFRRQVKGGAFAPPCSCIELVSTRPHIETIIPGPKVDNPGEWAAAMYFSYDNEPDVKKKPPKIQISHLPYK